LDCWQHAAITTGHTIHRGGDDSGKLVGREAGRGPSATASCQPRGRQKKSTDPPVHLLNPRPTHPPIRLFFSWQGEFKNTTTIFLQKVHVGKKKKNRQKFDVSFSSTFFVLSHFRVFFSDGSSKTLQKTFYKKIVSKGFYKKIDQKSKSKTDFFSIFFKSPFWAFLGEGSSKTR
jgi:hypothetical protein